MKKNIFIACFFVLIYGCSQGQAQGYYSKLEAREFYDKVNTIQNIQIVDVRTPEEFAEGHIAGAVNVDWKNDDFENQIYKLDKNKPVFVYCMSGRRSAKAVSKMKILGFSNISEMFGGMEAWRANNLPEHKNNSQKN